MLGRRKNLDIQLMHNFYVPSDYYKSVMLIYIVLCEIVVYPVTWRYEGGKLFSTNANSKLQAEVFLLVSSVTSRRFK
jgi:hypothetical protein